MGRSDEEDRISVSSVVYNLAGSETNRVDFLKSLVVGAVQKHASITDTIITGYQKGPGMRYRNFANWAQNNAEFISKFGTSSGTLATLPSVNKLLLEPLIPVSGDEVVDSIEVAEILPPKLHYWILQYMYENYPETDPLEAGYQPIPQPAPFTGASTYSYNSGADLVTIVLKDGVSLATFTPAYYDPDPDGRYLCVKYTPSIPAQELAWTYGSDVFLADGDPDPTFPLPWVRVIGDSTVGVFSADLTATDESDSVYSDARTPVHHDFTPIVTPASGPTSYIHYVQDAYGGLDVDGAEFATRTHKEFWVDWEVDTTVETVTQDVLLAGGVTRTDTITRTTEYLHKVRKTRTSTQKVIFKTLMPQRWMIYKQGSGDTDLDDLMVEATPSDLGFFYPPIPFRYDNKAVGPLQDTAHRWLLHLGSLGFDWDDDSWYWEETDIQVSLDDTGPDVRWTSLAFISHEVGLGTGWYYVESRPVDRDADDDITIDYPLYRVFSKSSASRKGFFRIRTRPSGGATPWVAGAAQPILDTPTPSSAGIDPEMELKYNVARKAFKKAYGSDFDDVLESIQNNDNIANIDHAYAVFGVSLNVKEDACKRYIYKFLEHLMAEGGSTEADDWMTLYHAAHLSEEAWQAWWDSTHREDGTSLDIQDYSADDEHATEPPPEPVRIPYPMIDWKFLKVNSVHAGLSDYKTSIQWAFVDENRGHGVLTKPATSYSAEAPAEPGELFFKVEVSPIQSIAGKTPFDYVILKNQVSLNWQLTADTWKQLVITGMQHKNEIYKEHSVTTLASDAVDWTLVNHTFDGDGNPVATDTGLYQECPFIFPMHETVYKEMSLVDATQMANACTFLVFNCYEEREEQWYETALFKVILIVVIVVISVLAAVFTGGSSLGFAGGAVAGLLSGGVALTTVGIIVGVLVDVVVGLALNWVITMLLEMFLPPEVSSILGPILSMMAGGFVTGGPDVFLKIFTSPEGLISLSMAVGAGVSQYLDYQTQKTMEDMANMLAEKNAEFLKMQELYNKEFGDQRIDPSKVSKFVNEVLERPDTFLRRTLMTGSDIVDSTLERIDNFAADQLQLDLP